LSVVVQKIHAGVRHAKARDAACCSGVGGVCCMRAGEAANNSSQGWFFRNTVQMNGK